MTTVSSEWVSGGLNRTVTSTIQSGETFPDFYLRHQAEVARGQDTFPVDP